MPWSSFWSRRPLVPAFVRGLGCLPSGRLSSPHSAVFCSPGLRCPRGARACKHRPPPCLPLSDCSLGRGWQWLTPPRPWQRPGAGKSGAGGGIWWFPNSGDTPQTPHHWHRRLKRLRAGPITISVIGNPGSGWHAGGPVPPERRLIRSFWGMGGDTNRGAYPARSPGCIARHTNAVAGGGADGARRGLGHPRQQLSGHAANAHGRIRSTPGPDRSGRMEDERHAADGGQLGAECGL